MVDFRGESPLVVIDLVGRVESQSNVLREKVSDLSPVHKMFIYDSVWLRACDRPLLLITVKCFKMFSKSLLKRRLAFTELRLFFKSKKTFEASVYAEWIRVKNNIIALYPELGLVCKSRKPKTIRGLDSLHNEYIVLNKVKGCPDIKAPVAVEYNETPTPALWLEYIPGRAVAKHERKSAAVSFARSLLCWYEYIGVETIKACDYEPLVRVLEEGVSGLRRKGWSVLEAGLIYNALLDFSSCNMYYFTLSIIHGDASVGNSLISNSGKLIITDWENSREDMIAYDLNKLSSITSEVDDVWENWLKKISEAKGGALSFGHEKDFSLIFSNLNIDSFRSYFIEFLGYTDEQTEESVESIKEKVLNACHGLVSDSL